MFGFPGRVAVAADLLKRGAAVNARDGDGQVQVVSSLKGI
jgi:hypothetical protein